MKRFVYLALALLVLAACTPTDSAEPTPETITCPDGTEIPVGNECPQPTTPEETPQETQAAEEEDESIDDLLGARFDQSAFEQIFGSSDQPTPAVNANLQDIQARALQQTLLGYTYTIREQGTGSEPDYQAARIHVREDALAIHYVNPIEIEGQDYDRLINGMAYCDTCRPRPEPREVDMPSIPAPLDLVLELEDATSARSAQSINGRQTIRLEATLRGEAVEVFVDQFSGLPLEIRYPQRIIEFRELSTSARDSAFTPPN